MVKNIWIAEWRESDADKIGPEIPAILTARREMGNENLIHKQQLTKDVGQHDLGPADLLWKTHAWCSITLPALRDMVQ